MLRMREVTDSSAYYTKWRVFSQQDGKNLLQSDSRRQEFPHSLNPISNPFSTKYEVYLKIKLQNTAVIKGVEKNKFLSFFARIYFRMT